MNAEDAIEKIYEMNEGDEMIEDYFTRHQVDSLGILTVLNEQAAQIEVSGYLERIRGKRVIEIGAGVGFLAIELAKHAKSVIAIEANPAWSWVFTQYLYAVKPAHLTWVFGTAESMSTVLRGDVAVVYTRSGIEQMTHVALEMCPEIILGPKLSTAHRFPAATADEIALAEKFAASLTSKDFVSRNGISGRKIRDFMERET